MKVYLIRHGESENNLSKCYTGWMQVSLTPLGEQDALRAGELLKGINFDKVYSSDLIRAMQTQKIALPDAEAETTPLLREINVGNFAGKKIADCAKEYGELYYTHTQKSDFSPFNGENRETFKKRIKDFFDMLEKTSYESVAVFCHAGVVKATLNVLLESDISSRVLNCTNGSITIFDYVNEKWQLDKWNYTGAL